MIITRMISVLSNEQGKCCIRYVENILFNQVTKYFQFIVQPYILSAQRTRKQYLVWNLHSDVWYDILCYIEFLIIR